MNLQYVMIGWWWNKKIKEKNLPMFSSKLILIKFNVPIFSIVISVPIHSSTIDSSVDLYPLILYYPLFCFSTGLILRNVSSLKIDPICLPSLKIWSCRYHPDIIYEIISTFSVLQSSHWILCSLVSYLSLFIAPCTSHQYLICSRKALQLSMLYLNNNYHPALHAVHLICIFTLIHYSLSIT